jgi:conjugative relaxase-like TrwC/TraI family protein
MTVRVTTLKGVEAGRYYTERLPGYYLDGGEPPGRWWGNAAEGLGLSSQVDPEAFLAVMAGLDPMSGEVLGRRYGEGSVRGYDATFSAPKSVSVLFALGDEHVREQVVEAHDSAVEGVLGWVEDHAHTRLRQQGHVVHVDTEGIMVGVFRQHTSRRLDPQLHTHAVIANKVRGPDGRWLALDARSIICDQRTLSALYHAANRAELTRRLGVEWETPEHGIAEIAGIPKDVLAEFSQRSNDIERRFKVKLERFRDRFHREPTVKERWKLEREAVLESRPAKPRSPSLAELRQEWQQRVWGMGIDPQRLVGRAIGRQRRLQGIDRHEAARIVTTGLEVLVGKQSSWRPAELVRELAAVVPTNVTADAKELTGFLDTLAEAVAKTRCADISRPVPDGVALRRDGRPITEPAVDRALTTHSILDEEVQLIGWAERRLAGDRPSPRWPSMVRSNRMSLGQAEAVAAVAGRRGLELIVGPAGAGKTTTLEAGVADLQAQGRSVFGVAPTAAAAEVLATETGMAADTLDKLLVEHGHPIRPPDPVYDLAPGTTVIVDEAGTASTPKLAELARLADQHHWRVVLVGDSRQFSAVGRGGMFAHLVQCHGAVELDQVHRFRHHWERQASLRLRTGDPGVLVEYDRRGRIHGGNQGHIEVEIIQSWWEARGRGETVALMANNTDTVTRLNTLAQQTRIEAGELDPRAIRRRVGDVSLRVGDEVVTRRNDRRLRTDRGLMVKNRDHWTITNIHRDGSITIAGRTGTIRLPADYVTRDLELGYAQTSHASQGRTVDVALLLVDAPTDSRGVYTPMTRGREANHAYVITEDNQTALDVLSQALGRDWIDQPAVARRLQLDPHHSRQVTPHPSRQVTPHPSRQLEPDGPGNETEEHSRQLTPDSPGDKTEEQTKSRILELVAERKARQKRVERSRGIGL